MSELSKLEPRKVWEIFEEVTKVPRPSKREGKMIAYLEDFATKHNLRHKTDAAGNVVIYKEASPSMKGHPAVVLQSHMDMVCEKNSDKVFDFDKDPIEAYVEDGWVKARGTTLGADDGIGIAAQLALLVTEGVEHPDIEALFTVDEETGLTGAFNLGKDMLSGKYLINLDSEEEGEICIGCAGGIDTVASFDYKEEEAPAGLEWMRADVAGLKGGHSGDNIDDGLGNSNKLLTRLLLEGGRRFGLRLSRFDGGNLRNAIPREAYAVFGVDKGKSEEFTKFAAKLGRDIEAEYKYTDPGVKLSVAAAEKPAHVMDRASQEKLLLSVQGAVNGVIAMSFSIPGLVETSSNLASVKFKGAGRVEVVSSQRSSVESAKFNAAATLGAIFELAGAEVKHGEGYPGWTPDPSSRLLAVTEKCYASLFGKKPLVRAIHAGLECGLFLQKYPHLEMVSFGPTILGAHSPDERLEISSAEKFWKLLLEVLKNI